MKILEKIEAKLEMEKINEGFDVKKIIQDLMKTDFKGSNEEQMKGLQLLKGLATNDSKEANAFMQKLSDAYTKIGKAVLGSVNEDNDDDDDKDDDKKNKKDFFKKKEKKKDKENKDDDDDKDDDLEENPANHYKKKKK